MISMKRISISRFHLFRILLLLVFSGLLSRFYFVQIVEGEKYLRQSNDNRIRQKLITAPRGLILDRYGKILVDNTPAYSVYAIPRELAHRDETFSLLSQLLDRSPEELARSLRRERRGPFQPAKLARHIEYAALARLEEHKLDLPGIEFDVEPRRFYPAGVLAPHLFGYLGEINEEELKEHADERYKRGDIIGKKGIEKVYEHLLRGEKGYYYVEVDAFGREVQILPDLGEKQPVPGYDLYLSIDAELQMFLEKMMQDKRGGAVVLNSKNGEILALVSKPDYDPHIFTKPIPQETWNDLVNNPDHPLYDRMVQSLYPPGSTFKIILAIAGLEMGRIDPSETVYCPGYLRLGIRKFECWKKGGHGTVALLQAIEQSCNVYFYRMMQKVGLKAWAYYARKFGFGKITGVDLFGESPGIVPDSTYFDSRYGPGKWSRGLLLNLAVGQGDLLVTPLQMATFAMALANRGMGFRPRLFSHAENPVLEDTKIAMPDTVWIRGIHEQNWDLIHQGMYMVVNGNHGTARWANPGKIKVAGKTGTAQNPHGEDHAWFIGFAPYDDPQIAFVVFVENGGGGGAVAAPIAGRFLKFLLRKGRIAVPGTKLAEGR